MKKLLASAMLAFAFLITPVSAQAICPVGANIDYFFTVISKTDGRVKAWELTPTGSAKALKLLNERYTAANLAPVKIDRFVIVVTKGSPQIGILQFYDGCLVPSPTKATINLTVKELGMFLRDAGVDDAEIIEVIGS